MISNLDIVSRREALGCGVAPIHPDTGHAVDIREWCDENPDADHRAAQRVYKMANLGHVKDIAGFYWGHCPRWYLAFSDERTKRRAARIMSTVVWAERGAISLDGLTEQDRQCVDLAQALRHGIDKRRREAEQARREAERKAKGGQ